MDGGRCSTRAYRLPGWERPGTNRGVRSPVAAMNGARPPSDEGVHDSRGGHPAYAMVVDVAEEQDRLGVGGERGGIQIGGGDRCRAAVPGEAGRVVVRVAR